MHMAGIFSNSKRALNSVLSNKAGQAIGGLDQPWRGSAQSLLDSVLPGFGGGTPDFSNNAYATAIKNKISQSSREIQDIVLNPQEGIGAETNPSLAKSFDWRARLRPKEGGKDIFYSNNVANGFADYLMRPIAETNGLIWQYTPRVFINGSADYNSQTMQGMNYPINTYNYSMPPNIPVEGDFTANDQYEARYLLAVLTFLKIATKGFFGDSAVAGEDPRYGTPPPVLLFEYLGHHMFNKVPVVVRDYQISLPDDVDYVPVTVGDTVTYLPTMTNILVTLSPTYTPHKVRRSFDLQRLANGSAYRDGFI